MWRGKRAPPSVHAQHGLHARQSGFEASEADGKGVSKDAPPSLALHPKVGVCYPMKETGTVARRLLGYKTSARTVFELASSHHLGGKPVNISLPTTNKV